MRNDCVDGFGLTAGEMDWQLGPDKSKIALSKTHKSMLLSERLHSRSVTAWWRVKLIMSLFDPTVVKVEFSITAHVVQLSPGVR